ncbi:GNAT family N-acetyltransferase [Aquisalibacillus elongatus]|uniref:RimJ/RimL family protein N-acetyltransferase n=1 Tax=Aquisalibacillus elongatus TaxID=485577 RepID=A0A3N5BZJ2_9BACI|nr:GNAT family N-acetyltransferase [Aquisalibacillus elongatus]RPF55248.1 RimJ/RimL family protein N-acetyltransferase [Aquisalibacillus elongatus]
MNPILLDIPKKLESDRLILRAPKPSGDGEIVNKAIKASINELKPWLPFAQKLPTIEETEANLRNAHINFLKRTSFRFLIFHKDTNEFIGTTSFEYVDWNIPKCEIGYWINTEFSGNGYILEAVEELIDFGFQQIKFNRIEIKCEFTNYKSRAIPEKLGFELEGILKNEDLSADGSTLTDTCIYARVN